MRKKKKNKFKVGDYVMLTQKGIDACWDGLSSQQKNKLNSQLNKYNPINLRAKILSVADYQALVSDPFNGFVFKYKLEWVDSEGIADDMIKNQWNPSSWFEGEIEPAPMIKSLILVLI